MLEEAHHVLILPADLRLDLLDAEAEEVGAQLARQLVPHAATAEVRFEGDVFEMEDQRNWTDASYKTYCTPLDISYPVEVEKGTKISQKVAIRLIGEVGSEVNAGERDSVVLTVNPIESRPLPAIGLGVTPEELTESQINNLQSPIFNQVFFLFCLHDG